MMSHEKLDVARGPRPGTVLTTNGEVLEPPSDWGLLPPGDAALTRRVKATGPSWTVKVRKGRKTFSEGVWAPNSIIESVRQSLASERSTDAYKKRKLSGAVRRDKQQLAYVDEFRSAVAAFLSFHDVYAELAERISTLVTEHATPVGSGTVARTTQIPIERRAEAAVIAWMRHHTTGYDSMIIPHIKGKRREVRRLLAQRSHELLHQYRRGFTLDSSCPLQIALRALEA